MFGPGSVQGGRERPRVVIADDHPTMRKAIEDVLSSSFEIVATVADGHQAVMAARRLDPDVVVLDISMPVLDGFGAARELVGGGIRAKLLLLSVHDTDKYVAAGIDAGANGYVAKPRLATDLEDAITHVLQGRLRVPSAVSLLGVSDPRTRHAAHLYANDTSRLQALREFAGRALRRGDTVVAIARQALLDRLTSRLRDDGFDLASLGARGRYQSFDVEHYLSEALRGGELDEALVLGLLRSLEASYAASPNRESGNLVVVGEGAPLLLEHGNVSAALALERLWHRHSGSFHTLCSYRHADLARDESRDGIAQLYGAHQTISA
jgi:DNA-binding NarL/FixJ family response regulator